ncbi:uroporphyrinogen-III C-methyltransferase [Caenimonas terrae]|uniref:Uroporphyrinogen-III C-methyltransferase n=1 Tax=Caenimonas terrae TaxID=696074 RepID=A0ABW0NGL0_9BURK
MSSEPVSTPVVEAVPAVAGTPVTWTPPRGITLPRPVLFVLVLLTGLALLLSAMLWQRLSSIQEQLARQSADSGSQAVEARTLARQAQDLARDTAARQAVMESRLSEVAMQRTQLEELMQSLSRSRDENLVVDIESGLRLSQQQAQLSGSVEPLLAALRTADQRLARAAQPRLSRLRAAIARDIDRLTSARVTDLPGLMTRLDELARVVDDLPLANAVASSRPAGDIKEQLPPGATWLQRSMAVLHEETRALLRVSRIDQPEAVLLAPEQGFFLRENLKLKLLNARLALLSRQTESARADVAAAAAALNRYFDPASRKTQAAAGQLQQIQAQMRSVELPRLDGTMAALATAAAGR